jgi:anthranilate phosphoribosyltransferase
LAVYSASPCAGKNAPPHFRFRALMIEQAIHTAEAGQILSREFAEAVMEEILSGRCSDAQIMAFLAALRLRHEAVDELIGFASAMRRHALPVFPAGLRPEGTLVDTCGTGGDAAGTFNISTAAAFVVAGAGVRVAKHGNRASSASSSRSSSADVLEALGVSIQGEPKRAGQAISEIGIGFLFAPAVHTAMKHAAAARRQLGGRTVFNVLGPLTNPAGARAQLAGVFAERLTNSVAAALAALGVERAFVVHGADGLDEITLSGETFVAEVRDAQIRCFTVTPEEFGLPRAPLSALAGGNPEENAEMIRAILEGQRGARRDIVLANASAALVAAGVAADFHEGAQLAANSIDSGAAREKLAALAAFTSQ